MWTRGEPFQTVDALCTSTSTFAHLGRASRRCFEIAVPVCPPLRHPYLCIESLDSRSLFKDVL